MNRATGLGPSAARSGPAGVWSLLGRAGEARSGFCREVKRREPDPTTRPSRRRLSSRQVPDCLRCPTEERARHRTRPPTNPPPRDRLLSEEGLPEAVLILKPQRAHPRNGWAGGQAKPGDAKRPPEPRRNPDPTAHHTRRAATPS